MVVREVFGCDDEVAICTALLHDTIEDTPTDFDDLYKRFGEKVAKSVAAMTKNMLLIEDEREADYDRRLASGPWQARLVKLADVYDNGLDLARPVMRKKCMQRCERSLKLTAGDTDRAVFLTARCAVQDLLDALQREDCKS